MSQISKEAVRPGLTLPRLTGTKSSFRPSDRLNDERGIGRVARRARTTDRSISSPTERARTYACPDLRAHTSAVAKGEGVCTSKRAAGDELVATMYGSEQLRSNPKPQRDAMPRPRVTNTTTATACIERRGNTTTRPTARGRRRPLGALNSRVPAGSRVAVCPCRPPPPQPPPSSLRPHLPPEYAPTRVCLL